MTDGFLPTMPCTMKQSWMKRIINKDAFTISRRATMTGDNAPNTQYNIAVVSKWKYHQNMMILISSQATDQRLTTIFTSSR